MKVIGGFVLAVLVTYLLGVAFISQGNIAAVVAMGFETSMSHRLEAFVHDVTHMYDLFFPLVGAGLLIAFLVAGGIVRFAPGLRLIGYVSAGFAGMVALHVIMKAALGLTGIAPTRELAGLVAQGVAGGVGGFVFHLATGRRTHKEATGTTNEH